MNNNPKYRQEWILDNLKVNPTDTYSVMFGKYSESFGMSDKTFDKDWLKANTVFSAYQEMIITAKLDQSIKSEKQAVKNGLKTKFDRLMILQNLVDECLEQLATKQCNDTLVIDAKIINIKRLMNQRELNDTRKTLNVLQVEISKIEGDYAVLKSEVKTEGAITTTFINFQGKDIPI